MKKLCLIVCFFVFQCISFFISEAEDHKNFEIYSGRSRFETSVEISKRNFDKSDYAVLVSGYNFSDALSGTSISFKLDCPLLITEKNKIPEIVLSELNRLKVKKIYVIGGYNSISYEALEDIDIDIIRIQGKDRYETNYNSIKKYEELDAYTDDDYLDKEKGYIVVTGRNFPDSVSSVGLAIKKNFPIKLVDSYIEDEFNLDSNIVIGGENSINIQGLKGKRVFGSDRYETSLLVAKESHNNPTNIVFASGRNFVDAIVSVSLSNKKDAPLLLFSENQKYDNLFDSIRKIYVSGGEVDTEKIKEKFLDKNHENDDYKYFSPQKIDKNISSIIMGKSFVPNKHIGLQDLVYIPLKHYNFHGQIEKGEIIVNRKVGEEVGKIFRELYEVKYPIEKIRLVENYGADDNKSMVDNNTSSFNYRYIKGTNKISNHALGFAIDINPKYNPHVINGKANPSSSQKYSYRVKNNKYMIFKNDTVYKIFKKYGWQWGGEWKNPDYQHFEKINK